MTKTEKRQQGILALFRQTGDLKVDELAERFKVSRETVRRDLARLNDAGQLQRVHGGARRPTMGAEAPFQQRQSENAQAKSAIAAAAAPLFASGSVIMVDGGTTTQAFAAALGQAGRYTVITNSIGVALNMQGRGAGHKVYLLGGECQAETQQMLGSITLDQITRFRADHAVLTIGAIDADHGCMDFDLEEAMVARAMLAQAQKVTLLADHSKFDRVGLVKVCELGAVQRIVTDRAPPAAVHRALQERGVEVRVARMENA